MARKNLIRQNQFPYHVYIRTNNKSWFQIPLYRLWDELYDCFRYALDKTPVIVHAYVLMGNHYHLLVTTPNSDLDKFMEYFNRKLSQTINRLSTYKNHKFANGYKWSIIDTKSYLFHIYRYIYQNPVKANLCTYCIDYPYSSLRLSPSRCKKIELSPHIDYFKYREWLEKPLDLEVRNSIKTGLSKKVFKIANASRVFVKQSLTQVPASGDYLEK